MKVISYLVLALFLAVSGLAAVYYVKSGQQDATIGLLSSDLEATKKSLQEIETSVEASDAIIGSLNEGLLKIGERGSVVAERLVMLERNNAEIRDLLSTRLPAGGCLLDNTCDAPSLYPTEQSPVDPVRPAALAEKR